MPLRVELRSRSGDVLGATGETYDSIDAMLPEVVADEFPLLAGVDRYENAIFNRIQMPRLGSELARLLDGAPERRAKMLRALIDLCEMGSQIPDSQLWFIAD
jgi:hypothetical protein